MCTACCNLELVIVLAEPFFIPLAVHCPAHVANQLFNVAHSCFSAASARLAPLHFSDRRVRNWLSGPHPHGAICSVAKGVIALSSEFL